MYGIKSVNVSVVPKTKFASRHVRIVMDRMKNDPEGKTSIEDRTVRVPCHCLELLEEDYLLKKFRKDLAANPAAVCPMACPYGAVVNYLYVIPDPFGALCE